MYTEEQYCFLRCCSKGLVWRWHINPAVDEVLRFLMDEHLITPREDLSAGMLKATQKGLKVLHQFDYENNLRQKQAQAEDENRKADKVKAKQNMAKQFRHDFAVAGFSVTLAFIIEHWNYLVELCKQLVGSFSR